MSDENELYKEWRTAEDRRDVEQRLYRALSKHATAVVYEKFPEGNRDLVHDIATAAIGRLRKFDQKSKFSTWVHAIAMRKTAEAARKLARRKKVFDLTKDVVADAEAEGGEGEERNQVYPVIRPDFDSPIALDQISSRLPEEDAALLRYKGERLSSAEIAANLGISRKAVNSRWARLKRSQKKKK